MLKASYVTFTLHHLEQKGIKAGEAEPRCKMESEISESCHCAVKAPYGGEGREKHFRTVSWRP